ncbi:hypothetical protein AALB16_10715 [Lachnospiraceae bacterium 62-35]
MFCGYTYASNKRSLLSHPAVPLNYKILTVQNAVFDEVYATNAVIENFDGSIPGNWTFDTIIHATFEGHLNAGNVNFTESIVEAVRIKKKTKKDNHFKTIYEKKIITNEDLSIEILDFLEPAGTVEYAYVPVISGAESDYIISVVESRFDGYFLCEKDKSYPLLLNASYNQQVNYETGQVKPLGRKYPITIINGDTGYKSGDMECSFIQRANHSLHVKNALDYRNNVYDFITDSQPKILKDEEGNLLLVHINGNITESDRQYVYHGSNNGFYYVKTKLSWVECGNACRIGDLYDNNLIDTDLDRE